MKKRSRKRGRPRTGHDPMVGLRLPRGLLRKIDKLREAMDQDRSATMRQLILWGFDHGQAILWLREARRRARGASGRGRSVTNRAISAIFAEQRAADAEAAAARNPASVQAEIKALRAREEATQLIGAEVDRIALAKANRSARDP